MLASARAAAPGWHPARTRKTIPILTLAVLGLAELMWALALGYRFAGFAQALFGVAVLALIALAYGRSGRSDTLSHMAYFGMLWTAFTVVGAILTYMATTLRLPLLDAQFQQIDLLLGFHWLDFYQAVQGHPAASKLLSVAYGSLVLQIVIAIVYFSSAGRHDRSYELWWAALATLGVTAVLSGLFPAAGAFQHYGTGLEKAVHLPHYFALRDGSAVRFVVTEMQGIVTFPSYHAVLAILFTYAYRGTRFFIAAALLNLCVLVSTPVYGGHYLVDMIGGGAVAILSVLAIRRCRRLIAS